VEEAPPSPSPSSPTTSAQPAKAESVKTLSEEEEEALTNRWRRQILYAYEDEGGEDVIASLDFWAREEQPPTL
jgi:hypothetical protein